MFNKKKALILAAFVLILFVTIIYSRTLQTFESNETIEVKEKLILLWNSPHRIEASSFGIGHDAFVVNGCSVDACRIVTDPAEYPMETYDAIIINMHELWLSHLPQFRRSPHQRLIFFTQESPQTMSSIHAPNYDGYFNWTMTYKLDSDVRLLYGRIEPKAEAKAEAVTKVIPSPLVRRKTRLVAWMVSHCATNGGREAYVAELSKYIPVDIYGGCGNGTFNCERNDTHWLSEPHCYDHIEQTYKFYLSFENSICKDYVTEKFFLPMQHWVVPIVYGGADYQRLAPRHSFIDARLYSPKELASYLQLLDGNPKLYREYFWWKNQYNVEAGVEQMARHGFCDLCSKLHENPPAKVYQHLADYWSSETHCVKVH